MILRRATSADARICATIQREANLGSLPFLPVDPDIEGAAEFFETILLPQNEVWIAEVDDQPVAYVAFHPGWLEHLYVLPPHQGRGIGPALMARALEDGSPRQLWTFQKNARARKFYEDRGWTLVELTDGQGNREKEPDALYAWPGR